MTRPSVILLGATLVAACHKEGPKAEPAAAPSAAETVSSGSGPARAEYHEDTFDLAIAPAAPLSAGKPGVVEVRVSAKGGYHMNDKYPYKFKVEPAPGVKYGADVFTKDALSLETGKATMKVDVVPESKGERAVGGTFSFSLCSAERCLVEKRALSANVVVD